jgi:hypothetical protein
MIWPGLGTPSTSTGTGMDPASIALLLGAGTNFLGGLFSGKGDAEMNEAQIAARLKEVAAATGMDEAKLLELARQFNSKAAVEGAQATPNRVGWRQNQAMQAAIMPGLRNYSVSSGIPGMDRFKPQTSGGLRLPEGGFGPETLKFFGDKAMLDGEYELDKANQVATDGHAPIPSYTSVYGAQGLNQEGAIGAIQTQLKADAERREKQRREAIARALGQGGGGSVSPDGYSADGGMR